MASTNIDLNVVGHDSGASATFGNVGQAAEGAGGSISKFGSMAKAGFAAAGAAALAAGAVIGKAIMSALDQEKANDRLAASLGATPKVAEKFGRISSNLYAGAWGESMDDVNHAVESVAGSFRNLKSEKSLQAVTAQAMDFAAIFETDLPRAVAVAKTVVQSGLAKNATQALDLMTAAAQRVPPALREDVMDAAEEYGQFFNTVGIKGPGAFALLAQGADKGIYGIDKTGDAIKEFTIRATDMSTLSKDTFKKIGLDANEMANAILAGGNKAGNATKKIAKGLLDIKDPAERANAAIALFGTPLEDLGVKDIPKFLNTLAKGDQALGKWEGSIKRAGATLNDNAATNFESFKRQVSQTFVELVGGKVVPVLSKFAIWTNTVAVPAVRTLGVEIYTRTRPYIDKARNALERMQPAFQQFNRIIVGQVIPIVATFAKFMQTKMLPQALSVARSVGQKLKPAFDQFVATVRGQVLPFAQRMLAKFREHQPTIQKVALVVAKATGKLIVFQAAIAGKVLPVLIRFAGFMLTKVWPAVGSGVIIFAKIIRSAIQFGGVMVTAGRKAGQFAQATGRAVATAVKWIGGLPGRAAAAMGSLSSKLYSAGQDLIRGMINGVKSMAGSLASAAGDAVQGAISKAKGLLGISSPSKVFFKIGRQTGEGFILGVRGQREKAKKAMGHLTGWDAQVLANVVKGIDKHKVKLGTALDRMRDFVKSRVDKLKTVLAARDEFARGFQSFASSVFQQDFTDDDGNSTLSVRSMLKFGQDQLTRALQLKQDVSSLASKGLSNALIRQLQESGESGIAQIHELATRGSRADIAALNQMTAGTQKALQQAGIRAGNEIYGDRIHDAQREKKQAQRIENVLERIEKAFADGKDVTVILEGQHVHTVLKRHKRKLGRDLGLT